MGRQRISQGSLKSGYRRPFRRKQSNVQRLGRAVRKYVHVETQEASPAFGSSKKIASRKAARKQARLEKKARRTKSQEGLPQRPLKGHSDGKHALRGAHGPDEKRRPLEKTAGGSASGQKGSTEVLHTGSNQTETGSAQQRVDSDEREVRRLEKLLGMNKRKDKNKLPASFAREGLDYVLAVTRPDHAELSDDEDHVWLKAKRAKVDHPQAAAVGGMVLRETPTDAGVDSASESGLEEWSGDEGMSVDSASEEGSNLGGDSLEEGSDVFIDTDSDESVEGDGGTNDKKDTSVEGAESDGTGSGDEEEEEEVMKQLAALKGQRRWSQKKGKGTGYLEGSFMGGTEQGSSKYIPPGLRSKGEGGGGERVQSQLKKKLNGLVNRLSEANLPGILTQVEQMYRDNSRNDMNTALSETLLQACVKPTLLPSKFVLEHMALVAALNVRVGSEVGAHLLQEIAVQFTSLLQQDDSGKGPNNLLLLLSHLYNFKVVHCLLVYDVIRRLMESLTERNIELLLLVLTNVGMAIRKDDPAALKEIIGKVQSKASEGNIDSPRMRFMLETMVALRTNNPRKIPNYDPSQVEHMTKYLRTLLPPGALTEARLKVSLHDLISTDKQGRWWVVGSAWTGRDSAEVKDKVTKVADPWLLELAREQRMNTDVRKSIFCILMTSEDYVDSFEKLLKLNLKEVQEREVVHVVVGCCLKERTYNPYYAYLGQKLCQYKKANQVTFQYAIWDKLKMLSSLPKLSVNNLWRLISHLVAHKALSLGILRVVEFAELDKTGLHFHRSLLKSLLCDYTEDTCSAVFARIAALPHLKALREALLLFLHHFLREDTPDTDRQLQPELPYGSHHSKNTPLINFRIKLAEEALKNG